MKRLAFAAGAPHRRGLLIGMVHVAALPGSPRAGPLAATVARACDDAGRWFAGGADAILVENFGDRPFFPERVPPITVAALARVLAEVLRAGRGPVGVNVLRNDAEAALSLAAAFDLAFFRVNVHAGVAVSDQGLLEGRAHETVRLRERLPGRPSLLADLRVKHAEPLAPRPLPDEARDLLERAGADALLLTGPATGRAPDLAEFDALAAALPGAPILLASGVDPEVIAATRGRAAGWIVGTWAKRGGNVDDRPDPARIRQLVRARR